MAKFPVESDDNVGVIDALNYLLAGPQGLGQDFSGQSFSTESYLLGNHRPPFTQPGFAYLFHTLGTNYATASQTGQLITFTFNSPLTSVDFSLGQPLIIYDASNVIQTLLNNDISLTGVIATSNTSVTVRTSSNFVYFPTPQPNYRVTLDLFRSYTSTEAQQTDCIAYATVTSNTDRVFVTGQLAAVVDLTGAGTQFTLKFQITRYKATTLNTDGSYNFVKDKVIANQVLTYTTSGQLFPTVSFTPIIDTPLPGYYYYGLEVVIARNLGSSYEVLDFRLENRNLSCQVVKQ